MASFRLSAIILLLVAGCGGSRSTYVETGAPPPAWSGRSVEDVEVFTATAPTRPFREAGIIVSRQTSEWSEGGENGVMHELRRAAAERGCDGVILTGSADEVIANTVTHHDADTSLLSGQPYIGQGVRVPGRVTTQTNVTTLKGYRAVCIVYTHQKPADPKKRAMADAGVTRTWRSGKWQLGVSIATDRVSLEVHAVPAVDPDHLRVALHLRREIKSSTDRAAPPHEACDISLVSDGQSTTVADRTFRSDPLREIIEGTLERAALEAALATQSATIKVCDTEIALTAATSKRLAVFLDQLRAETADKPAASADGRLEL